MDSGLILRRAAENDAETIARFNCQLCEETEHRSLDPATVLRGVVRGLQKNEDVQYWVAESSAPAGQEVVGQLMITREWSDWRDGWMMWLQSVYVAAPFRGQGIFRQLLSHAIGEMQRSPDIVGLRLYVEAENSRAMEVYQRLKFQDAGYRVMERLFDGRK
ncbi:MAG: GNAT family N-acetyltransferase [Planctomycetaceae bacterium]|nr:GNAT family N-acetyltransferase [Planctomycetaceae bacterium]